MFLLYPVVPSFLPPSPFPSSMPPRTAAAALSRSSGVRPSVLSATIPVGRRRRRRGCIEATQQLGGLREDSFEGIDLKGVSVCLALDGVADGHKRNCHTRGHEIQYHFSLNCRHICFHSVMISANFKKNNGFNRQEKEHP